MDEWLHGENAPDSNLMFRLAGASQLCQPLNYVTPPFSIRENSCNSCLN